MTNDSQAHRQYLQYATFLALSYILVYGWLLVSTDFLPYVMDNNESFSSYWHAINLAQFDFFQSFGLTDEAYGFSAAAHPYVYTHQGNFPRLFNLLIYALGAHSIESQIAITTFTVGVAAIFMAYHFFSKIANPLFALVCCLLLITDYVLVAQWQVVTYRVWHGFFVFSSMLCVHRMVEGRRFWAVLTVINFACLFYYEFIFVAFVSLSSALYAAFLCRHAPKRLLGFWLLQGLGGAMALAILALQLYLYLGWEDLKMDAYLTFVARNDFRDSAALLQRVQEFFDTRNIVFWYNLEDGSRFRTKYWFIASLFYYEFQTHTPFLTTLCLSAFLALITALAFCAMSKAFNFVPLRGDGRLFRYQLQIFWSTPVKGALMLSLFHLLHKYYRDDFGALQQAALLTILGAVVTAVAVVIGLNWSRRAYSAEAMRKAANFLGLAILVIDTPSIYKHVSSNPILLNQYSIYFIGFLLIFLVFFFWVLWKCLFEDRASPLSFDRIFLVRIGNWAVTFASFLSFLSFFVALLGKNSILGIRDEKHQWLEPASLGDYNFALIAAFCATALLSYVGSILPADRGTASGSDKDQLTAKIKVAVVVFLMARLIDESWRLFHPRYEILWPEVINATLSLSGAYILATLVMILASAAVFARGRFFHDLGVTSTLKGSGVFILTGFIAYVMVYILSPGYIFTGYRFRHTSFTVFHTVLLMALPVYCLLRIALNYLTPPWRRWTNNRNVVRSGDNCPIESATYRATIAKTLFGVVSVITLGMVFFYWGAMQRYYIEVMPPDHYSFLKKLSRPPYVGQSFITNTYAAPIAAKTGVWAYLNGELITPKPISRGDRNVVPFDTTYLWFADKRTNLDYAQPDYFICVVTQSMTSMNEVLRERKGDGKRHAGCEMHPLIQMARGGDGKSVYPALEFSEADEEGPGKLGYERWAIIRLDWTK